MNTDDLFHYYCKTKYTNDTHTGTHLYIYIYSIDTFLTLTPGSLGFYIP